MKRSQHRNPMLPDRQLDAAGVGRVLDLDADDVCKLAAVGRLPAARDGRWSLSAILSIRSTSEALRQAAGEER